MNYITTHQSLAAFLRYALGDDAHTMTEQDGDRRTISFTFDDPGERCSEIAKGFFAKAGAPVTDARVLLDVSRDVRKTITTAIKVGTWRNER
jgi:hypothetical protein